MGIPSGAPPFPPSFFYMPESDDSDVEMEEFVVEGNEVQGEGVLPSGWPNIPFGD